MAAPYLPEGGQELGAGESHAQESDSSSKQFPGKNVRFFFQCIISKQGWTFLIWIRFGYSCSWL